VVRTPAVVAGAAAAAASVELGVAVMSGRGVFVGVGVAADCAGAHDASTGPRLTTATIRSQGHSFEIDKRREVTVWVSNLD
jgi:hypothetical protein